MGTMAIPLYTTTALPGAHLVIGDSGLPVYQREAEAIFTVNHSSNIRTIIMVSIIMVQNDLMSYGRSPCSVKTLHLGNSP